MGRRKILVIDDDSAIVGLVSETLIEAGYSVSVAGNGAEGLKLMTQVRPDLILLDINMPVMGGISFYHEIANLHDGSPKIPVLIFTGRGNLEPIFKDFNVDGFLAKPFAMHELLKKVQEIIAKRYGDPGDGGVKTNVPIEKSQPVEEQNSPRRRKDPKKILITEPDEEIFQEITHQLLNLGYLVKRSRRIEDVPTYADSEKVNMVLIRLETLNLLGAEIMTAIKMKKVSALKDIPIVYYVGPEAPLNAETAGKICETSGAECVFKYSSPADLSHEAERIFNKKSGPQSAAA